MVSLDDLERIRLKLESATSFSAIFGMIAGSQDSAEMLQTLKRRFSYLAKIVHPDHAPSSLQKKATETFKLLDLVYEKAQIAIKNGKYDQEFNEMSLSQNTFTLKSNTDEYQCEAAPFRIGDLSRIYSGVGSTNNKVLIKIASSPSKNPWLDKEAQFYRFNQVRFLPSVLDSFLIQNGSKKFRAIVFSNPGTNSYISISDALDAHSSGIDPRDAAWMSRRIMGQAALASAFGVVHTAINPDHVLLDLTSHDPLHIGWVHSIALGSTLRYLISKWKSLYPPEVFAHRKLDEKSDVYMAAMTIWLLFGKDLVPNSLDKFLTQCINPSSARRPPAYRALDELTRIIRSEWGRVYRGKFQMPNN